MPGRLKGPPTRPSKYQAIADHLATQQAETVTLALTDLEALLGFPLIDNAWVDTNWWRTAHHAWVRSWRTSGWTARLDVRRHVVTFTRDAQGE